MCHPEVPAGQPTPVVERDEVDILLPGGEEMPALLSRPERGPAPSVLIAADIYGRTPFYESLAARLASAGFEALLPDFFFRVGPLAEQTREAAIERRKRLDGNGALADLRAALAWLRRRPGAGARVGTLGFCLGGTFVLKLAALEDDLATVCYYGFPAGPTEPPTPIEMAERMSGPILGFWGDQDAGVGMDNVAELGRRLAASGADYQHRVYPGIGHGFLAASRFDETTDAYQAACESWTMSLELWRQHLRVPAAA
jgi:carboxymethylenebutenolidase